jgi:hypothetical protein
MIRSILPFLLVIAGLAAAPGPAAAQRQRLSMDPGWRFSLDDPAGADQPRFDDSRRVVWLEFNGVYDVLG